MYDYLEDGPVLIVAPKRVAENTWSKETAKWEHLQHLRVSKIMGNPMQRLRALKADADIYVINRENVVWLVDTVGMSWPFKIVIIDELSSFKSAQAKRWKALRRVRGRIHRLIGLTGTPRPNGLEDLWPEVYLLDQGARLGRTISAFRSHFLVPEKMNGHIVYSYRPRDGAEAEVYSRLSDICMSVKKEDVIDLPGQEYIDIELDPPAALLKKYKEFEHDRVMEIMPELIDGHPPNWAKNMKKLKTVESKIDHLEVKEFSQALLGEKEEMLKTGEKIQSLMQQADALLEKTRTPDKSEVVAGSAAALTNKLLQFANGAIYDMDRQVHHLHDIKLDALEEMVEEANGEPLLVLYAYQHDADRIRERIQCRALDKPEDFDDWDAGRIPVALAHPASIGHGLNLQQGGHLIVWFGLPWSLELYQQANERLNRPGQRHVCRVYHLILKGTHDERVLKSLKNKEEGQDAAIEALRLEIVKEYKTE